MFGRSYLLIWCVLVCWASVRAGVLRESTETEETTAIFTSASQSAEVLDTRESSSKEDESEEKHKDDEGFLDASTTTEDWEAQSRDGNKSIVVIDKSFLDPAPGTLEEDVQVDEIIDHSKDSSKFAKLLLSLPRVNERPKEFEESAEESEELAAVAELSTAAPEETTTLAAGEKEEGETEVVMEAETTPETETESQTESSASKEVEEPPEVVEEPSEEVEEPSEGHHETASEFTPNTPVVWSTKLYPINETFIEKNNDKSEPTDVVIVRPAEPSNSNYGATVLHEAEADYVVVASKDADHAEVQEASIPESLEIFSVYDEPLLVNHVQSW